VEGLAESAVSLAVDELGGRAMVLGQGERGAGTVRQDRGHGQPGFEHGPQDRPGTRDKDGETHDANLVEPTILPTWDFDRIFRPCQGLYCQSGVCWHPVLPRVLLPCCGIVVGRTIRK